VALDEGAVAISDLSVTAEFLCLRVDVLLTRAEAAPEVTADSPVLRFVAIVRYLSPKKSSNLILLILPDFTENLEKSFNQLHQSFALRG
jgi:hypothetical protein